MLKLVGAGLILAAVVADAATAPVRAGATTERVSVGAHGRQANGDSGGASISADGRFVAFASDATNLVPGDTNRHADIFVRDRSTSRTERVSTGRAGKQANGDSFNEAISAEGRYVAFASDATNLVPGDSNSATDIFVHDRQTGTTERVSVATGGAQATGTSGADGPVAISADGRFVAFTSDAENLAPDGTGNEDVYVRDRQAGTTERVSVGPGGVPGDGSSGATGLAISADGRYVAFASKATNLVPGDTNGTTDVFIRDRQTGTTERASVGPHGRQGDQDSGDFGRGGNQVAISADGRSVAFTSDADNLIPGDTNRHCDVFVRDRVTGETERVSVRSGGGQAAQCSFSPSISGDGRLVAFVKLDCSLNGPPFCQSFEIFAHDRTTGRTQRVNVALHDPKLVGPTGDPSVSADGRFVAFTSDADNLVPDDTNDASDVFVRRR